MSVEKVFACTARWAANYSGRPIAFIIALATIVLWFASGPVFGFSDTWQLIINTGTTIVTFLMVFLLQHSQNHDTQAMHLKLDALVIASERVSNQVAKSENLTDDNLRHLRERIDQDADDEHKP